MTDKEAYWTNPCEGQDARLLVLLCRYESPRWITCPFPTHRLLQKEHIHLSALNVELLEKIK